MSPQALMILSSMWSEPLVGETVSCRAGATAPALAVEAPGAVPAVLGSGLASEPQPRTPQPSAAARSALVAALQRRRGCGCMGLAIPRRATMGPASGVLS